MPPIVFPKLGVHDEEALRDHLIEDHNDPSGGQHAFVTDYHNHMHQISQRRVGSVGHVHKEGFYDVTGRKVEVGQRLCLVEMPNDPSPIPVGATCIVTNEVPGPLAQLWVEWEPPHERRTLCLTLGDRVVIVDA